MNFLEVLKLKKDFRLPNGIWHRAEVESITLTKKEILRDDWQVRDVPLSVWAVFTPSGNLLGAHPTKEEAQVAAMNHGVPHVIREFIST